MTFREFRRILFDHGCTEDPSRGKGSHTMFFRRVEGKMFSLPVPTRKEVLPCYLRQAIQRLHLPSDAFHKP